MGNSHELKSTLDISNTTIKKYFRNIRMQILTI